MSVMGQLVKGKRTEVTDKLRGEISYTYEPNSRLHSSGTGQLIDSEEFRYDPAANRFSFWMADEQGAVRQVVYPNPKPANFEDAEQVVVNGRVEGDVFVAEHILVKCPSKYNDERGLEGVEDAAV